jgi:hypothetical protein
VRAALERVVDAEREFNVRRTAQLRLFIAGLSAFVSFLPLAPPSPVLQAAQLGTSIWAVVALGCVLLLRSNPSWWRPLMYAPPVIDVSCVGLTFVFEMEALKAAPELSAQMSAYDISQPAMAIMCAMIVFSVFSLSWQVTTATAVYATFIMMLMLRATQTATVVYFYVALVPLAVGLGLGFLVTRLSHIVRESRKKDLLGKYVLGERIGAGGMAEVFSATYCPEGGFVRQVAVKKILASFAENPEAVALFRREAELGATLAHPNLVHVLDFGSDGSTFFLAMEYVDGCSLSQLMRTSLLRGERVAITTVTYIAWSLADALDSIHEHITLAGKPLRLVHRDVNPPNVLVSKAGEVKLADFGIAREVESSTLTAVGTLRGKLSYSAPEQILGQPFDERADLYSLGVTLWEISTSQRLFSGASESMLIRQCLEAPHVPPSQTRPDCPTELDEVILGLLERDPAKRTPSARALMQQLLNLPGNIVDSRAGRVDVARLATEAQKLGNTAHANVNPTATPLNANDATATINTTPGA